MLQEWSFRMDVEYNWKDTCKWRQNRDDFDPKISKENIGLWKKYPEQSDINKIYTALKDYCY